MALLQELVHQPESQEQPLFGGAVLLRGHTHPLSAVWAVQQLGRDGSVVLHFQQHDG